MGSKAARSVSSPCPGITTQLPVPGGSPPSQAPSEWGGWCSRDLSPELLACICHQFNLLPLNSGTPLAPGTVVADSGQVLAGDPCLLGAWVAALRSGLLVFSVVAIRTNLLTQKPRMDGARVGPDWLVAIKVCRGWQHSVTLHRERGCSRRQLGTPPDSLVLAVPTVFCSGA